MKFQCLVLILIPLAYASNLQSPFIGDTGLLEFAKTEQETTLAPRLVIYAQTFTTKDNKPISLLPLITHKTKVTHVILASLHLHEKPGTIRLNDAPLEDSIYDELWEEVRILQANGVKVMTLLGGAAGGSWKRLTGTESEFYSFYHPLAKLIQKYHIDGLDIDIEEEVDISVPLRLMNALYRDFGSGFIITMTPLSSALSSKTGQNLSGFSYFVLDTLATVPGSEKKLVTWYNGMFYGKYPRGPPTYDAVIDAGWDPERVVMVVLDNSENGPPNGFRRIENLQSTIKEVREMYPVFGGVAGWEYYNAGGSDSEDLKPWQWVRLAGDAVFEKLLPTKGMKDEI